MAGEVGKGVEATGDIPFKACWIRIVCAGLMVSLLPWACGSKEVPPLPLLLPLPSGPQMTRRIGKSLAQLLTRRAVLIAVGLAGEGGGRGWMVCTGPVGVRRSGGGGGTLFVPEGWLFSEFTDGEGPPVVEVESLLHIPCGDNLDGLVGLLDNWDSGFVVAEDGYTGVVGFDGVNVDAETPFGFGARIDANNRTVRWWASVAMVFRLRKKKYWMMMGARTREDAVPDWNFSIRAQVR